MFGNKTNLSASLNTTINIFCLSSIQTIIHYEKEHYPIEEPVYHPSSPCADHVTGKSKKRKNKSDTSLSR